MSSTPNPPSDTTVIDAGGTPRWVVVLFVLAFVLVGYLLYANYYDHQALRKAEDDSSKKTKALVAELEKTNSRVADLKGQLDVTSQKLGLTQDELARARSLAQGIKKSQQQSDEQLRQQIGAVQQDTSTKFGEVATEISGTKSDVAATKADLEATKGKLQSTIATKHYMRRFFHHLSGNRSWMNNMLQISNRPCITQMIHNTGIKCYISIAVRQAPSSNRRIFRVGFGNAGACFHSI